jgi:hypothetical protein
MNVDRARFLLLTTALSAATAVAASASGCTVKNDETDAGTTVTPGTDSGTDAYTNADAYTADSSIEDAGACLDDTGLAPTCEGAALDCASLCAHYLPNFKNGVGRAITECIIKLPTCESADVALAKCVDDALAAACPDPTAEDFCAPLSNACGPGDGGVGSLPLTACNPVAAGLNTAGRNELAGCLNDGMDAGYCVADPTICINTIK